MFRFKVKYLVTEIEVESNKEGVKELERWLKDNATVVRPKCFLGSQRAEVLEKKWSDFRGGKMLEFTRTSLFIYPLSPDDEPFFENPDDPLEESDFTNSYMVTATTYTIRRLFLEEKGVLKKIANRISVLYNRCLRRLARDIRRGVRSGNPAGNFGCSFPVGERFRQTHCLMSTLDPVACKE